jgi:hypothetical protein
MRYPARYMLLAAIFSLACAASSPAAVRVYAKVDSGSTIYPGQVFTYSVVVEGGGQAEKIDMAPLAAFSPRDMGPSSMTQSFNGRVTVTSSRNFAITAGQPGTMKLPGVTVTVDGQTYTTNPVEVTVSKAGTTDRMTVEVSVSPAKGFAGQPLVMKVRCIFTADVRNVGLTVPVFKTDDFYFEDTSRTPMGSNSQQVAVDGVPVTISQDQQLIKGMQGTVISFEKVLIPKRSGKITLEPAIVSADMAVGQVQTNDIFERYRTKYERFSAKSQPVELDIQAMPETGKLADFYGLVGRYTISASATPTKVNVGDPITLTIRIGGSPYLKPVQWPQLEKITGLGDNFKIPSEKASPTIDNGEKVFTQTLRATSDSAKEIPAIPLAYFDPETGGYAVVRSKPIPLEVAPTKVLTNADVQGSTGGGPVSRKIEAAKEGFAANYYGPDVLVNQSFSVLSMVTNPPFAAMWSVPLLAFVASVVYRASTRTSPESIAAKRRRQACGVAVHRLKAVASADSKETRELLISAMKGYLGDRFDRTAGSLTADECRDIVCQATGDEQIADQFKARVSEGEAARYASIHSRVDSAQIEEVIRLIRSVEEKSKR